MQFTLVDILVIVGELGAIAIASLLLWRASGFFFERLTLFSWLNARQQLLKTWQQRVNRAIALLWAVASLFAICINIILLTQGQELLPATREFLNRLPPEFWVNLSSNLLQSAIALVLAAAVQRPLGTLLHRASTWVQNIDRFVENDASIDEFFKSLKFHLSNGIWLAALFFCGRTFGLTVLAESIFTFLKIYLAVAIGLLVLKVVDAIVDSLDAMSAEYVSRNSALASYARLRAIVPFLKRCLEYGIYLGIATLSLAQIEALLVLAAWGNRAMQVLGIILASRILIEVSSLAVSEFLIGDKPLLESQRKRRLTLVPVVQSLLKYGIFFWSGVLILNAVAIDPAPILAAAGLLGLAVGLGAQNLINDTVSGLFILFENYYLVGDYVEVEGAEGMVEAIELRTTQIRHPNGQLQILRNGDITSIVNFSREYIYAVVDVGVAYDSDLNRVYRTIEALGIEVQKRFPDDVLEPTEVDGLEAFGQSKLIVRAVTKLKPNNSRRGVFDDIQGELRKMIKEAFDREGIVMLVPAAVMMPVPTAAVMPVPTAVAAIAAPTPLPKAEVLPPTAAEARPVNAVPKPNRSSQIFRRAIAFLYRLARKNLTKL